MSRQRYYGLAVNVYRISSGGGGVSVLLRVRHVFIPQILKLCTANVDGICDTRVDGRLGSRRRVRGGGGCAIKRNYLQVHVHVGRLFSSSVKTLRRRPALTN